MPINILFRDIFQPTLRWTNYFQCEIIFFGTSKIYLIYFFIVKILSLVKEPAFQLHNFQMYSYIQLHTTLTPYLSQLNGFYLKLGFYRLAYKKTTKTRTFFIHI